MSRLLTIVLFLVLLALVRVIVVPFLPPDVAVLVDSIIGGILSLACAGFWILLWVAPGTIYRLRDEVGEIWERLKGRRTEIDDLMQRIHHLGKPHQKQRARSWRKKSTGDRSMAIESSEPVELSNLKWRSSELDIELVDLPFIDG